MQVSAADLLLVAMRWLHALAAVAWVGAILFELLALSNGNLPETSRASIDDAMREIVQTSLIVFLVSGAILTFDRLSSGAAGPTYVVVLGLKVLLSVAMFQVWFRFRRASGRRRTIGLRWLTGLGLTILFLAAVLKTLFERALAT